MKEINTINLVLFMPDKASVELGPALWAAFKEVEKFYNTGKKRVDFRFHDIGGTIREINDRSITLYLRNLLFRGARSHSNEEKKQDLSKRAKGKFFGTVDAWKVSRLVDELLKRESEAKVIVIDEELTPPRDWRYIIWLNRVISTVPIDPRHWGVNDPFRIAIIKHRVRTACLSIVGNLIGLGRCGNENCFLYRNVDSVMRLDEMVKLGPEHRIGELEERGFNVLSDDPRAIQPVVLNPMPRGGRYE
jgi:hypothetical protein